VKPLHLAVLAAVVAVAVVLYLTLAGDPERQGDRSEADRPEVRSGSAERARDAGSADGEDRDPSATGPLSATVKVLGPAGEPVAARLELSGRLDLAYEAADDGTVTMDGLFPGLYTLLARAGRATGSLSFELKETTDLGTIRLGEGVAIRGKVVDVRGQPLANARVAAVRGEERRAFDLTFFARAITTPEDVAARTTTADDGSYELLVLKGGTYGLRANAKGFAQEGEPPRTYTADSDGHDFYLFGGVALEGRVVDSAARPIPGARVMMLDPLEILGRRIPKAEATTGDDGSFALTVAPGESTLLVTRATGFAASMMSDLPLPQHDLTIVLEPGIALRLRTVRADQPQVPAPNVNVALIFLGNFAAGKTGPDGRLFLENLPQKGSGAFGGSQRQAFLWGGDYVSKMVQLKKQEPEDGVLDLGAIEMDAGGIVRGKVLDKETGEPVAKATVRVFGGHADPELEMMGGTQAVSGEDGSFEIKGVPLKAHTVTASHPDYVSNLNPMLLQMRMRPGGGGGPPLFEPGRTEAEHVVELAPAAKVTGVVLDPEGNPVAGASVTVEDPMMMMMALFSGGPRQATTDAEGRFDVGGLRRNQTVPLVAGHRDWGRSRAKKGKAGGDPITFRLTPPLRVSGRVVDEAGDPIEGVRVTVRRKGQSGDMRRMGMFVSGSTRPAVTDAEGRYVVRNAPAGELEVLFEHRRYEEVKQDLSLRPDVRDTDLEKTVLPRGEGIEGIVLDERGEPLAGARVSANSTGQVRPGSGRTWGSAKTDLEGRLEIYGLRKGEYRLRASYHGRYAAEVVVESGTKDVRIRMREAGRLAGRARGVNGMPVPGAQVRARVSDPSDPNRNENVGWTRTDPDGRFSLDSLPPDRPFQLTITHDAYREATFQGVVAQATERVFVLDPGVRVAGIVVDADGAPVANAQVFVAGGTNKSVTTDADGRFEAGGLHEGEIKVTLLESGQGFIKTEPRVVTPGDRNIRLVAIEGESIKGKVVDAEGNATTQVRVRLLDAEGSEVADTWVWRDDGNFELRGLPPGTYTIVASRFRRDEQPAETRRPGVATGSTDLKIVVPE